MVDECRFKGYLVLKYRRLFYVNLCKFDDNYFVDVEMELFLFNFESFDL